MGNGIEGEPELMAKQYTNRTCYECGIKKPQPEMIRRTISIATGSSNTGVSALTLAGAALGEKSAQRTVKRRVLGTGKREYARNKEVWLCEECSELFPDPKAKKKRSPLFMIIAAPFYLAYYFFKVMFIPLLALLSLASK